MVVGHASRIDDRMELSKPYCMLTPQRCDATPPCPDRGDGGAATAFASHQGGGDVASLFNNLLDNVPQEILIHILILVGAANGVSPAALRDGVVFSPLWPLSQPSARFYRPLAAGGICAAAIPTHP